MQLLHVDSSISADGSVSRRLSAAILAHIHAALPDLEVVRRDLATTPPPHLTLEILGDPQGNGYLPEFEAADILVIGAGMYNFTVPSQLKAWIDHLVIAGRTFRYTEKGPQGLSGTKSIYIALARGASYAEGSPFAAFEHAQSYLISIFAFLGFHDVRFVCADGLALGEEMRDSAIAAALAKIAALPVPHLPAAPKPDTSRPPEG